MGDLREVGVFLDGPTNDQPFTLCCGDAVTDRNKTCPSCGARVYPETHNMRFVSGMARWRRLGHWGK